MEDAACMPVRPFKPAVPATDRAAMKSLAASSVAFLFAVVVQFPLLRMPHGNGEIGDLAALLLCFARVLVFRRGRSRHLHLGRTGLACYKALSPVNAA